MSGSPVTAVDDGSPDAVTVGIALRIDEQPAWPGGVEITGIELS